MKLHHRFITFNTLPPPPPHRSPSLRPTIRPHFSLSPAPDTQLLKLAESIQRETLKILEWPSLCAQFSDFTSTSMGLNSARTANLPLGRSLEESRRLLEQTSAAVAVARPLDFSGVEDVVDVVEKAVRGEVLSIREICAVGRTIGAARLVLEQLEEIASGDDSIERYSPLLEILQNCDFLIELEQKIGFCINCAFSVILDQASEELEIIRSERKRNIRNLESMLKQISTQIYQSGGSDKPLVTTRRSRMCVAVRSNYRSMLPKGVVLDTSSSGATYFIEPREAVDLNNLEVMLSNSEKMEEQAVLSSLSGEIARSGEKIKHLLDRVLEVDLAFARASHARWINGVRPNFSSENCDDSKNITLLVDVDCIQHPLLLEPSLRKPLDLDILITNDDVGTRRFDFPVPIDIKIGRGVKVVVISGPNTGGKTASMKTLGLASIMLKAGMYLPAKNRPSIPWFDLVMADIGDNQSLEQSLSTFSGQISQICKILTVASKKSLVLLDEIGSGTDPSEGVALSTSILQYLKNRVNLALVTTHYADLTRLKENDARFENAAMEFSLDTLQPTYRILWGSRGESNALSIAKSIGFDGEIIERAQSWVKKLTPEKMKKRNSLLYQSLNEERNRLETQAKKAESVLSETMKSYYEIRNEADDLDNREAALKSNETQQIQQELKFVKTKFNKVVEDFENQLSSAPPDQFNLLLKKAESTVASIVQAHQPSEQFPVHLTSSYVPQIGEKIRVKGLGTKIATVVEAPANDNTVLVQYGKMRFRVNLSNVTAIGDGNGAGDSATKSKGRVQPKKRLQNLRSISELVKTEDVSYSPAVPTSKNTLDLRGMRFEEATIELEMAINSKGSKSVLFIIHGMGTGVLKERVIEILQKHKRVAKFEQESPMNYGCTVAYIK